METNLTENKMTNANDNAFLNEYLGYIETGATEAEAVMQVATSNEIGCCEVFDALVRTGVLNPCGYAKSYALWDSWLPYKFEMAIAEKPLS